MACTCFYQPNDFPLTTNYRSTSETSPWKLTPDMATAMFVKTLENLQYSSSHYSL
jgi:hypothetical protein